MSSAAIPNNYMFFFWMVCTDKYLSIRLIVMKSVSGKRANLGFPCKFMIQSTTIALTFSFISDWRRIKEPSAIVRCSVLCMCL